MWISPDSAAEDLVLIVGDFWIRERLGPFRRT